MVSSSIWDSTGMLESWLEEGSFLSLPFGLCLALEPGRPAGQRITVCDPCLSCQGSALPGWGAWLLSRGAAEGLEAPHPWGPVPEGPGGPAGLNPRTSRSLDVQRPLEGPLEPWACW